MAPFSQDLEPPGNPARFTEPAFGRFVKNVAEDLGYAVCVTTEGRGFIEAYGSFKPTTSFST